MDCINEITDNILYSCLTDKMRGGIEWEGAVLMNLNDIDKGASTTAGAIISDLVLGAAKTGFKIEWYKDLASSNSAFAPSTEGEEGFLQNFLCRLPTTSAEMAERAAELKGGRFAICYISKYKGVDNLDAFKVRGFELGLELLEMTENTAENDGAILFTLGTKEGNTEKYPYMIFREIDYATSKATFDSLFASV